MTTRTKKYRIVLCGDADTGKTVFLHRIVKNIYEPETFSTIGVDFQTKTVTHCGFPCALQFWDTAGRPSFRDITTSYFKGTSVFLLFYDIGRRCTFDALHTWIPLIKSRVETPIIFLVGTKLDGTREIMVEEAGAFALTHGAFWADVSSKTGEGFAELETRILKRLERFCPKRTDWEEPSLPTLSTYTQKPLWITYLRSWLL